jgi:hypothetical protein
MCNEFIQLIDEVYANGDLHLICVVRLRAAVNDNSCVHDGTIVWDVPDFILC